MQIHTRGFGAVGVIIIVVIIGVIVYLSQSTKDEEVMMQDNETMMESADTMMEDESMSMNTYTGTVLAGTSAPLLEFTETDYEAALKGDKLIVLYFYAQWCPYCKAEFKDALVPAFNALERDDVIGFRVHYNDSDTGEYEKGLAREFGVAYQHTKVFIQNGERILKSPDTWDVARYQSEIAHIQ